MPITEAGVKPLIEPLAGARPITSKKMFGGLGIYCEGVFFAVIDDDRLYFKVDSLTEDAYIELGAEQWIMGGNPPTPAPYREVPKAILEDSAKLGDWIDAAVGVANRKKSKPKK